MQEAGKKPPGDGEKLFDWFDWMSIGRSDYINLDIRLSDFGKFCNILVEYVGPLITARKSNASNFSNLLEHIKSSFASFQTVNLFPEDPSFNNTLAIIQPLLSDPNEENMLKLENIYINYYKLFYYRLRRAHCHLALFTQAWSTNDQVRAKKQILDYIEKMVARKPEGVNLLDPLLLDPSTCRALETFLVKTKRPMLKCSCGQRADIFALPCNCPCYCRDCWEFENHPPADLCPLCKRPCKSMIEVTH